MTHQKQIGKRIRQRRKELKLTREQMAERVDISVAYLSMIENGISFPRCDVLIKLINGLECSADPIFCDVLLYATECRESFLPKRFYALAPKKQHRILSQVEWLISEAENEHD